MTGKTKSGTQGNGLARTNVEKWEWLLEMLLPGVFIIVLLGCLIHLGYCALQAEKQPMAGFHYAISAFAL